MLWEIIYKLLRFFGFWIVALLLLTLVAVIVHWATIKALLAAQVSAIFGALFSSLLLIAIMLFGLSLLMRSVCC